MLRSPSSNTAVCPLSVGTGPLHLPTFALIALIIPSAAMCTSMTSWLSVLNTSLREVRSDFFPFRIFNFVFFKNKPCALVARRLSAGHLNVFEGPPGLCGLDIEHFQVSFAPSRLRR